VRAACITSAMMLGVTLSSSARADTTHECVEAASSGQTMRDSGKLISARDAFVRCSVEACPAVVRESCERWSADVITRLPSITLGAKSEAGEDLADVAVSVDGSIVTHKLDGHAIAIDPGPHDLIFHADGFTDARQSLIVREGEKARPVVATLSRPAASEPSPKPLFSSSKRDRTPLVVTGAITAVGAAGFAVFGIWGQSEKDHLSSTCAPSETCAPDDVSAARTKLIVADISLAVGVIGAGFFTAFLIAPLFEKDSRQAGAAFPSVGVAPTKSGAFGTLEWRY
jgi:hypothetical protein